MIMVVDYALTIIRVHKDLKIKPLFDQRPSLEDKTE